MAFDTNYGDRKGFDPAFLWPGKADAQVLLPSLSPDLAKKAATLTGKPTEVVLRYRHFSLVVHKVRRFAIYSAANVDFKGRYDLARPQDVWRLDPRISPDLQVSDSFYSGNAFDRGHLTRREDQEFGSSPSQAIASAADTCHWTNCTPQHARFNEGSQLWQGLERHILEEAVDADHFRAQVITGPVFDSHDPVLSGFEAIPYPLRYWKVVAAINRAGKLFATAYVLDQSDTIAQFGLRGAPDVPFTPFKTYQTTIASIERLTQLTFAGTRGSSRMSLSAFDPLTQRNARSLLSGGVERGERGVDTQVPITTLDDVVLQP
jgi:endonuclease G